MRNIRATQRPLKSLALLTLALAVSPAMAESINVYVDGSKVNFQNTEPIMVRDRVMVPLRGVFEQMGASVDWSERDQSVTCMKGDQTIRISIGDPRAWVNDKTVNLDQSAMLYRGTTMVPLRFVSESLGADVKWNEALQSVNITTADNGLVSSNDDRNWNRDRNRNWNRNDQNRNDDKSNRWRQVALDSGTVIPVKLDDKLSSERSREGDKFTATIDTSGKNDYSGLPEGTKVIGHVSTIKPMEGKEPGVLGLDYDTLVTPDGYRTPIQGSSIDLDNKSVDNKDGVLVAKSSSDKDHKSVWIGAGAGAVLAAITKGNILTDTVIGAALGYLYERIGPDSKRPNNVTLDKGTRIGVRLESDIVARIGR